MRTYKSDLSVKGLRKLADDLREYKNVILPRNTEDFVRELSDAGIRVAEMNKGTAFADYVTFTRDIKPTKYNYQCKAVIIGFNSMQNIQQWLGEGGTTIEAEVNSIMMMEYGSGQHARSGYRGTFPNQTHAMQPKWGWVNMNGEWCTSEGYRPRMPMYKAWVEMLTDIIIIGRRCFSR